MISFSWSAAAFVLMFIVRLETYYCAAVEFLDLVQGLSVGTAFQAPKIVDVGITQVENRSLRILLQHVALLMSLGHHFPLQTLQSSVVHESLTLPRPVFARPSTSVQTISQYGQLLTSSLLRNSSNIGRRNWNCAPLSRTRASTF